MNGQQTIDGVVGQRQPILVHEDREHRPGLRPHQRALAGRHQRRDTRGFAAESAQIGRCEAEADQRRAIETPPARADVLAKQPPHHLPEGRRVKIAQIDDIVLQHCR